MLREDLEAVFPARIGSQRIVDGAQGAVALRLKLGFLPVLQKGDVDFHHIVFACELKIGHADVPGKIEIVALEDFQHLVGLELKPDEVLEIFESNYLNLPGDISVTDFEFTRENDVVKIDITFLKDGEETELEAQGNGSLSAINDALRTYTGREYSLEVFTQHKMCIRDRYWEMKMLHPPEMPSRKST